VVVPASRKLGIVPGGVLTLVHAPAGWRVEDLPETATVRTDDAPGSAGQPGAVVIAFFRRAAEIEVQIEGLAALIFPAGSVWMAWPRRAGGHTSDITDSVIRGLALPLGIVDTKVAMIDDDWSGLRFVWRKDRRGEPKDVRAGS
jgi:hypothetical protein